MDQLKSELQLTISELNRKFNKKLKVHLNQIERQQYQINHQNGIIDELVWQIRELRDSVRKCNEQISCSQSKYCIECAKNHMTLDISTMSDNTKQSDHVAGKRKITVFLFYNMDFSYA